MKTLFFISVAFFFVISYQLSFPQNDIIKQNLNFGYKVKTQTVIFNDIETGILTSDVKKIAKYFSPQPYISLINGVNGYYSSNQAFYILEDFFTTFKVIAFEISETKTEASVSFGKGDYSFEKKGKREVAHVYVTLSKSGSKWFITQISIN